MAFFTSAQGFLFFHLVYIGHEFITKRFANSFSPSNGKGFGGKIAGRLNTKANSFWPFHYPCVY